MASFLEREQLLPVAPSIAPADQILGAFNTKQSLFGIGEASALTAYNNYGSMQLSNPQNQQQHDQLMKTAGQDLKSATMKDLSIGDNQSSALSVFDPILKDQDIIGDHALTQGWQQDRARAENARISNGGKGFNSDALRAVNAQQQLFVRSDKSTWRTFYNNKESYNPYTDEFAETQKIAKSFKTDVIDKDTQNGAYITTTKDSSWYKDKWQAYFEASASPQLKAQIAQRARANYYTDMLTIPREAMVQKYTDLRNGLIKKQMYVDGQNMMNIGAQLALFHNSKDNSPLRAQLTVQSKYLSDAYDAKKTALNTPLEGSDAVGTVEGLATGTRIAEGLAQYQYFDKMGDAFAHKEEKFTIKPDYAYLALTKIKEQSREFGIRQAEVSRHNKADEGIGSFNAQAHMLTAQAAMLSAQKKKDGEGDGSNDDNNPTNIPIGGSNGVPIPSNKGDAKSDSEKTQTEGKKILDRLSDVQDKYNQNYDNMSQQLFSKNIWDTMDTLLKDPTKQGLTLKDIADPTRNTDGTGGNSARMAKFIVAAGALNEDPGAGILDAFTGNKQKYDPTQEAMNMPLSQVKQVLREIWSDPAMFKKGIEAIKGNDPSVSAYAYAAQLEKSKQRIDGEHADIVNQAVPMLKTNLGKYASLFQSYFDKGIIPTKEDIRREINNVPLSSLKEDVSASDIATGPKAQHFFGFKSQDDLYRETMTNTLTQKVLGTLGVNRTAYNTGQENFFPNKGNPQADNKWKNNIEILVQGAEQATKGNGGSDVTRTLEYARNYPELVEHIQMNSVDEAHDTPYMQIFFKKPTTAAAKADPPPQSGLEIPTVSANSKFQQMPLDDRTLLLNNKALKFQSKYDNGVTSNLSIYNSTGDKRNPQFDINPDFSYQSLDIDKKTGDIKGIITIHKAEEVNSLTQGRPNLLGAVINVDPSAVYNVLANKLIKNRDAVNVFLQAKGSIKNINDLPEFLKTALQNNSF